MVNNSINREIILDEFHEKYSKDDISEMSQEDLFDNLFDIAACHIKDPDDAEEAVFQVMVLV